METIISKKIDSYLNIDREYRNYVELSNKILEGLPVKWIEDFKNLYQITDKEVASLLAVNTRTITRLKKDPKHNLPLTMSDRLYRMFNVLAIAIKVFNNVEEAVTWLKTKQFGLDENVPLELLKTEAGAREVESELMRIEYGIY